MTDYSSILYSTVFWKQFFEQQQFKTVYFTYIVIQTKQPTESVGIEGK